VLERVEEILCMVTRWGEEDKTAQAMELLSNIKKTRAGEYDITLVIEDPIGNSAIIAENSVCRKLTRDEAALLKTGMIMFDKSEVEP
jgi:zinc finger protein